MPSCGAWTTACGSPALIDVDLDGRSLVLEVDPAELARRRAAWVAPTPRYTTGALAKYARLVGPAAEGAVTQ